MTELADIPRDNSETSPDLVAASLDGLRARGAAARAGLVRRVAGDVVGPADPDWDAARRAWNLAVDQRPELVVRAADADDVAAVVGVARETGLRVAPQGTGHNASALGGDLAGTILLRTDRMNTVTLDSHTRTVRAEAGSLWADVTEVLAPYGLVGLAGSSEDVGVAGYLLGGGCSWLSRQYGLASNSVTAIELVTGDGQVRRIDAEHDPDLFWAMRGGAGNAAIVTALEFTAYPVAQVYGGALLFPIERAQEVFRAYREWARTVPDTVGSCLRLLRLPDMPEIPETMRGRAFVGVDGVINESPDDAGDLLRPLRDLGPEVDMFASMPAPAIGHIHMDPPGPVPGMGDGMLLADLPDASIDALMVIAGPGTDCPLLAVDLRHLGGALGRSVPGGGVVDHLPGEFLLYAVGIAPEPAAAHGVSAALATLSEALAPWVAERHYVNFSEVSGDPQRFYAPGDLERLLAVAQRFDPDRVVRANHEWVAS